MEDVVGRYAAHETAGIPDLDTVAILLDHPWAAHAEVPVAEGVQESFAKRDLRVGAVLEVVETSPNGLNGVVSHDPVDDAAQ